MKQFKFITVGAMMAFLLAGCADDDLVKESVVLPVSGDEIEFGAAPGGFTDVDPTTRTIYDVPAGSTFDNYTLLNIKWQYDIDKVRVYCPEGAEGFKTADYTVKEVQDASSGTSTGYLLKNGETGVRWGDTKDTHNFYAFYSLDRMDEGLQDTTIVTATIPTGQEGGKLLTFNNKGEEDENGTFKVIAPDMTFCLMAGKGTWTPGTDKQVALTFTPIVTVLDVLINGPETVNNMKIASVSVRSKSGKKIVGTFTYDFASGVYNFKDDIQTAASIATVQTLDKSTKSPMELKKGEQLNVKFFLLPRTDIQDEDLVVSVLTEGGIVYNKTLKNDHGTPGGSGSHDGLLSAGMITRVKTPKLGGQTTNNWMSQIPDNALFTQLSLPGSKNSFAYNTAESFDPNTGISHYYQALPPLGIYATGDGTQFDEGVRVFDVHLNLKGDNTTATPVVYAGGKNASPETSLATVLDALNKKIHPNSKPVTECAVVFLNFVSGESAGGTASVSTWLSAVTNALNTWNTNNTDVLTTLSTDATMGSMRGKIAVIINLEKQVESSISATAPINYIIGLSTSVQNIEIVDATYNGSAGVRIQNLQQCNNPSFSDGGSDDGNFAYRSKIGVIPYFIAVKNHDDQTVSCNLLETKKALMEQINQEIARGDQNLFINDLSGFCVTKNRESTGYAHYGTVRSALGGAITWANDEYTYDYKDFTGYTVVTNLDELGLGGVIDIRRNVCLNMSELGNGGNTCLFAQEFNAIAVNEYSSMIGDLRQPLGIVLMNFAGVPTVKTSTGIEYSVQGVRLPGLIMMNNFMFPLKTGTTTTRTSSDTSYSKEGNVWD